ncbi:hypothetical protein O9G_003701 [Rozella allomycis CSF55]|uniref:SH3 domain-containing protein n=1 Tax=Rozella allomycis (strain CSF55) TaxID=988480 RepID=A0A075AS16_ROZAC|nr:hypothetical protein O9G_003701 [Rozella allomycis CSF55]|eukprot:EPZ32970.1 hypothetical protein O9G_003701 [Rozella allomycis CSF55]
MNQNIASPEFGLGNNPVILLEFSLIPNQNYNEIFQNAFVKHKEALISHSTPHGCIPVKIMVLPKQEPYYLNMVYVSLKHKATISETISILYEKLTEQEKAVVNGIQNLRISEVIEERLADPKEQPLVQYDHLRMDNEDLEIHFCLRTIDTCIRDKLDIKKDNYAIDGLHYGGGVVSEKRKSLNQIKRRSSQFANISDTEKKEFSKLSIEKEFEELKDVMDQPKQEENVTRSHESDNKRFSLNEMFEIPISPPPRLNSPFVENNEIKKELGSVEEKVRNSFLEYQNDSSDKALNVLEVKLEEAMKELGLKANQVEKLESEFETLKYLNSSLETALEKEKEEKNNLTQELESTQRQLNETKSILAEREEGLSQFKEAILNSNKQISLKSLQIEEYEKIIEILKLENAELKQKIDQTEINVKESIDENEDNENDVNENGEKEEDQETLITNSVAAEMNTIANREDKEIQTDFHSANSFSSIATSPIYFKDFNTIESQTEMINKLDQSTHTDVSHFQNQLTLSENIINTDLTESKDLIASKGLIAPKGLIESKIDCIENVQTNSDNKPISIVTDSPINADNVFEMKSSPSGNSGFDFQEERSKKNVNFAPIVVLIDAALEGNIEDVRSLLEKGVDPNSVNEDGITALHCAACNGHVELVDILLQKGANVNATDADGWTPLHGAACRGDLDVIKMLLAKGANIEAKTADKETALDLAENVDVFTLLQERKYNGSCLTVLYDFDPSSEIEMSGDELAIKKGQVLNVLNREDSDWWFVENEHGLRGYIPFSFVQ